MARDPANHTAIRYVRVPDEDWSALAASAAGAGGRSSVLRRLIARFNADPFLREAIVAQPDPVLEAQAEASRHRTRNQSAQPATTP